MAVYELMKDSKLPWIGAIPSHWHIIRIKELMQNVSEKNHPNATVLSLYREHGVLPKDSRDDNHNVTSLDTASYKFVRIGELVINKMKAWQGALGVSDYEGIVSPAYYVCRFTSDKINTKYFHYLIRCKAYAQEFERLSTGMRVGQWDLGIDDFMCTPAIIPPIDEQTAIAAYLDDQCAKIDSLIAEAKASIEEYKQWKASLIFEAVTKGLDPNVEMKDSRVEWIGKIPSSWSMHRIRINYSIISGNGFSPALQGVTEGDLPVCKASDISIAGKVITSAANFISYETANANRFNIVPAGSIIFAKIGEAMKKNNRAICGVPCCIDNNCQALVPEEIDSSYSYYLLRCIDMAWFDNAGTIPCISNSKLKDCHIPFPTIHEQEEIAEFLDCKCSEIDSLVREKQELIIDFEQYKHSLIYETVTGKRKVV